MKPRLIGPPAVVASSDDDAFSLPVGRRPAHEGASYSDPTLSDWYASGGSADADLLPEWDTLARRSRDLERNNGYITGAVQSFKDSIVGHKLAVNPAPNATLLGWDATRADEWARYTRAQFETWFNDPSEFHAGRVMSGRMATIQAIGGWFMNGDHFALPFWKAFPGCRWNTKIMPVEGDRVDTPPHLVNSREVRKGIEYDKLGAVKAIWFRKVHPGDHPSAWATGVAPDDYVRVPAYTSWGRRRVIMLFDPERAGQSRGRPMVTSIIRELRMAGHYTRTELQAAIVNALVAGVLESNMDPETAAGVFASRDQDPNAYWKQSMAEYRPRLKGGAILQLPLGASFKSHAPQRPNSAFDAFMQSVLHNIAAGLGISYEILTKDFTRTSYSSARATLLETWRFFMSKRAWIEEQWLQPMYELWLEEAVNAGVIEAPGFYENRYAYARCNRWTMAGRGWVDPNKEAQGGLLRRRSRVTSLMQECAEQGNDWREVIDQTAIEEAYMREKGIDLILPEAQNVRTDSVDDPNEEGRDLSTPPEEEA